MVFQGGVIPVVSESQQYTRKRNIDKIVEGKMVKGRDRHVTAD